MRDAWESLLGEGLGKVIGTYLRFRKMCVGEGGLEGQDRRQKDKFGIRCRSKTRVQKKRQGSKL